MDRHPSGWAVLLHTRTRRTPLPEHRCANCWVAQYGMKSNLMCKNEWWSTWDYQQAMKQEAAA